MQERIVLLSIIASCIVVFLCDYFIVLRKVSMLSGELDKIKMDMASYQSETASQYHNLLKEYNLLSSEQMRLSLEIANSEGDIHKLDSKYDYLSNITELHEKSLHRLSNGTSNADVLDQMSLIKHELYSSLNETETRLTGEMLTLETDVTSHLNAAQAALEDNIQVVSGVVKNASSEIRLIQSDVTDQLTDMSNAMNSSLFYVNNVLADATHHINMQVNQIQRNIDEYVSFSNKQFAVQNDFVKYQLAGTFTLLACLISLYHVSQHQKFYFRPDVQRRIMAIIWMVPIYSLTSWLSLVFGSHGDRFFGAIRDCYEAYVVYTFFALLIAIMEEGRGFGFLIERTVSRVEEEQNAILEAKQCNASLPSEHIKPPFPWFYDSSSSLKIAIMWLYQCKLLLMQFVMLRPLLTVLPFILESVGVDYYHIAILKTDILPDTELWDRINWACPHLYLLFVENISVALAFYGLLNFYHGTEKELAWCEPWPKFLCIKGVVFMTFWQGVCINSMSAVGMVDERSANQIQHLLICVEMLLASIVHLYVFPYYEWEEGFKRDKQIRLKDTLAFKDFMQDVKQMVSRWSTEATPAKEKSAANEQNGNASEVRLSSSASEKRQSAQDFYSYPKRTPSYMDYSPFSTGIVEEQNQSIELCPLLTDCDTDSRSVPRLSETRVVSFSPRVTTYGACSTPPADLYESTPVRAKSVDVSRISDSSVSSIDSGFGSNQSSPFREKLSCGSNKSSSYASV